MDVVFSNSIIGHGVVFEQLRMCSEMNVGGSLKKECKKMLRNICQTNCDCEKTSKV
jgi:hypothetical protein